MKRQLKPTVMKLTNAVRSHRSTARRPSVWRRMIVVWLSLTLISVPLLGGRTVTPPAQAQITICGGTDPNRIFQGCPLGAAYEVAYETFVLDQVLTVHELPFSDRSRVLGWERGALRTLLYSQMLNTIKKAPGARGEEEKGALNALAARIKQKRIEAAQLALDEYNRWKNSPCTYEPPTGFNYDGRQRCAAARLNPAVAGPIDPPKFEEFQAYGVARAYGVIQDLSVQRQMDQAARAASFFGGLGGAVAAGGIGLAIAANLSQQTIAAIFPFIYGASEFALKAGSQALTVGGGATAAAAGVSATTVAIGGAVLVVVAAIVISVLRGIDVANINAIPGKLQEKLDEVQSASADLTQLITTDAGLQEVFSNFFIATLPDFPATEPVPATQPSDPQFRLQQESAAATTAATINFKSWRDDNQSARLNGGWFINKYREDNLDKERWTLDIDYLNWRGEAWTAGRAGAGFIHTKLGDPTQSFRSAEIKYLDGNGNKFTASIVLANLEIAPLPVVVNRLNNPTIVGVSTPQTLPVAIVNSGGQPPNTLAISVNNGASATVTGVTIANPRIDAAGRVTADLTAECAASAATFTLRVTDNAGQSKSTPLLVRLSPVAYAFDATGNTLPSTLPGGVVGARYNAFLSPLAFIQTCALDASVAFTAISGRLPRGLSFGITDPVCVVDHNGVQTCTLGVRGLVGTPTTGGVYDFTVKMTFGNGDSFSRDYLVNIARAPAPLPSGALSWWSGERGVLDDLNNNHGRPVGGFPDAGFNKDNFAPGKVGLAFSFTGDNSAVQLPEDFFPFNAAGNHPFTFETWFKTAASGVIIGQQNTSPFGLPSRYTPGIYVGTDGRLRVQMFAKGAINPLTSSNAVNDDDFHHVAVVYNGGEQVVYLDGSEMGRATHAPQVLNAGLTYQFGTGWTGGWPATNNGRFNFRGLIDEPTLYNRPLTEEEVQAIYAAGNAGKIQLTVTPFNPTCAGNNGVILAKALGNSVPYSFALDRAGTPVSDFQPVGVFFDLTTGNYNVKIKDALGRTVTREVTLSNSNPITFDVTPVNATCSGASNGSLTINATGGASALQYSINGGQSFQSANVFSNLAAGAYNVIVNDNSGCSATAQSVTLTDPAPITAQVSGGGLIRPGQTAVVNVALSGGAATYTVTLSNNGGTRTGSSPLSFTIGPQATTTYTIAAATDASGCSATVSGSATITVDGTPPTITCPTNQSAVVTGTTGPVTYIAPTVSDNQPGATVSCTPAAGVTFALGVTTVNCTATDAVGNTSACSLTMTVRQPREAIRDFITRIRTLPSGTLTPAQAIQLLGHLERAITSLERGQTAQACTHLQNFVTGVNTFVSGGQLTAAQGQLLLSYTNQLRNAVGCAGSPFPT